MIYLGIDPGTSCGWSALDSDGKRLASGTWNLKSKRHEGGGMRYLRLRTYLRELLSSFADVDGVALAYEEVRRHAGTSAAHVYGGIVAVVAAECEALQVPYQAIPVGTVKKHATDKGNASKTMMMQAASSRWGRDPADDDEADALWIADALREQLAV